MTRRLLLLTFLISTTCLHADDQVRSVQEELRRRNIYFGDIDGRRTPELREAVSRYQKRKGFSSTGEEDRNTLRSLGLLPRSPDEPPPKELSWPEEPVLKSDTTINVAAAATAIAAETGVSVESVAPHRFGRKVVAVERRSRRSRGRTVAVNAAATGRGGASRRAGRTDQTLTSQEINSLVNSYLKATSSNDVRRELELYADSVNYYHNGVVDRRIIERALRGYYQRWPSRKYSAATAPSIQFNPGRAEFVVTMQVDFKLKNRGRAVRGRTENRFIINAATADPRITAIQERRLRS